MVPVSLALLPDNRERKGEKVCVGDIKGRGMVRSYIINFTLSSLLYLSITPCFAFSSLFLQLSPPPLLYIMLKCRGLWSQEGFIMVYICVLRLIATNEQLANYVSWPT